jgi:hypothetical protein
MSTQLLERFRLRLLGDPALRARLEAIAHPADLALAVVALGASCGEHFSASDVAREMRPSTRTPLLWPGGMAAPPAGRWVPHRLHWIDGAPRFKWCDLGDAAFEAPFFEQTIARCLSRPLNRLLAFETPPAAPEPTRAGPAGLIFHMSRCGSTLIAQLLAAVPGATVLSEPGLVDDILGAHWQDARLTDAERIGWLRGAVGAFQREAVGEGPLFIKLDCWHVRALPLITQAFPETPWIFVYRDPLEVMVSHARQRGRQMVPGLLPPAWLDLPPGDTVDLDAYTARVLARLCEAAVAHQGCGRGRLVGYETLPDAVWTEVAEAFGLTLDADTRARMGVLADFHAKRPTERFVADTAVKRLDATPRLRGLAAQAVGPAYDQLLSAAKTTRALP